MARYRRTGRSKDEPLNVTSCGDSAAILSTKEEILSHVVAWRIRRRMADIYSALCTIAPGKSGVPNANGRVCNAVAGIAARGRHFRLRRSPVQTKKTRARAG